MVVEAEGAGEAARVAAASGDVPVVLAVAVPRDGLVDEALVQQDAVLVAARSDEPAALLSLAVDGLEALGVPARPLALPDGAAPARALAAAGIALLPPLRAAVEAALDGDR